MKFLLLPVTLFLWLILTYALLWIGFSASLIVANFTWMALIFSALIILTIGIVVAVIIPTAISVLIEAFYKNRFINRLHAIFGIVGVLLFLNFLTADHVKNTIITNWVNHKAKLIVLSIPMIVFFISMIYSSISMILIKNKDKEQFHLGTVGIDDFSAEKKATDPSSPTEQEMKDYLRKARAFRAAKNEIAIQRKRSYNDPKNSLDSEKDN